MGWLWWGETVVWHFTPRADGGTFVSITNEGFSGNGDEVAKQAIESAAAFAFVLSGAKAVLEHNLNLNLIADHAPE